MRWLVDGEWAVEQRLAVVVFCLGEGGSGRALGLFGRPVGRLRRTWFAVDGTSGSSFIPNVVQPSKERQDTENTLPPSLDAERPGVKKPLALRAALVGVAVLRVRPP